MQELIVAMKQEEQGYDPVYGARPLKRLIQRESETRVGRKIFAARSGTATTSR